MAAQGVFRYTVGMIVAACAAAGLAVPASADPPAAPAHPEDDYMGSTLATHEPATARGMSAMAVAPSGVQGVDVSHWQGRMDWNGVAAGGAKFAYMKATEGITYRDPEFQNNYAGSVNAGLIRGAYHFALPDVSSAATQANYFVDNGGGWSGDGATLPPVLDIEYNPYGATCYGFSAGQMVAWVEEFLNTVRARTGRWPIIYTTRGWWRACTGNNPGFALRSPLWIAGYNGEPVNLPYGWPSHSMWQYASSPIDQDVFNGSLEELRALAVGNDSGIIDAHYAKLGGSAYLGTPTGGRYSVGAGTAQDYTNGTIYFTPGTRAWALRGDLLAFYRQLGGPAAIGFPGYDDAVAPDGTGRYSHFQTGSLFWSPATNTHSVVNGIRDVYGTIGWEHGALGYPTTDETCSDGIGCFNRFQRGSISWSPSTGAHFTVNAIGAKYGSLGYERSGLGYPLTDETASLDGIGSYSHFQGGTILWSPSSGAHFVTGGIRDKWGTVGWERGALGYPTTDETCTDGIGCYNRFQRGSIAWTPSVGTHYTLNAIDQKYGSFGYERSGLGYPLTDETASLDGIGSYNHFQGGTILWSPSSGAHMVTGGIRDKWGTVGWERGALGYPTTDETCTDGIGCYNRFQRGSIGWTPATGAHYTLNAINALYASLGYEQSRLGYPVTDEYAISGGARSNFQGGYITWWAANGAVQVTYY